MTLVSVLGPAVKHIEINRPARSADRAQLYDHDVMSGDYSDDELRERIARDGHEFLDDYGDEVQMPRVDRSGKRRRVVLLGAGASVEAGLPDGAGLLRELHQQSSTPMLRSVAPQVGDDVERAIHVIELLAEAETTHTVGYALRALGLTIPLQAGGTRRVDQAAHAAEEVGIILDYIRARYWLGESDTDRVQYLRPLVDGQRGGTIATLNYDNTLALVGAQTDLGGPEHPPSFVKYDRNGMHRVLNLHGTIGWELRSDRPRRTNVVVRHAAWQDPSDLSYDYRPAIIFGAANKLRSYGPYLALYFAFQEVLRVSRTLITLGYSWRDDHINDTIRAWATDPANDQFSEDCRRRLVVGVGPNTGSLPDAANDIRRDHAALVEVQPVRGPASEVIPQLFDTGGEFDCSHIEQFRRPWCSS